MQIISEKEPYHYYKHMSLFFVLLTAKMKDGITIKIRNVNR